MSNDEPDDWDDDWDDDFPEDSDEPETIECPHCQAEIYEDSPQCPVCGEYVTSSGSPVWKDKPVWYILLAGLGILAVLWALLRI